VDRSARPSIYTIAPHKAFADALAAGLIARFGGEKTGLARGLILLPNNRSVRTVTDAFVRCSGGGLLLPRLLPIGGEELGEQGSLVEPLQLDAQAIPPAISRLDRLMLLARLIQRHLPGESNVAESLRLAEALATTLDQLQFEEVEPARLRAFASDLPDLSQHWQKSLERLELILDEWPKLLAASGRIDPADRRNRILDAVARRWRREPPEGFVVAAGIDTTAPAVCRLMRTIAFLPDGMVVLHALDLAMPEDEWGSIGPHPPDPETGARRRSIESHPQFHLKLLLERMGIARNEVETWRRSGGGAAPAARSRAISHAMAPAAFTAKWPRLKPAERRLTGVRALELAGPAEEAQAVALAMREALEVPGRTVALVTPDRGLARRVSAHLRRWDIEADDSAGRPLSRTPPGTLLLALATAAVERFAPVALIALLNHPLVMRGERRLAWLDGVRALDLALRGPRLPPGLAAIGSFLEAAAGGADAGWWRQTAALLRPVEAAFEERASDLGSMLAALRQAASRLSAEQVWSGLAGRAAAELFSDLEAASDKGPAHPDGAALPALLEQVMAPIAIRPPYGQHPRVFIWGLIEARLQHADLMILAGLNEGVWPALPAPDPWLAPRIRRELGLPSLEHRIGLAAHDFAAGLGGREVLVTRSRRDARAPSIPSRLWLRLEAMTGGMTRCYRYKAWARAIDRPASPRSSERPRPRPPRELRPNVISVTEVDRLKADPYAFYARKMLGLAALDPLDAEPSPAWRGSAVHAVLEHWMKEDDCEPARLRERAHALLDASDTHPLMRALWQPRLLEALEWIADQVAANRDRGRLPLAAEVAGSCRIGGVFLKGKADRLDRFADGSLAVVDYKTGKAPSGKAVHDGFAMQLGLLGLIAEHGGFEGISGSPAAFEYWSLAKYQGRLGHVSTPVGGRQGLEPSEFTTLAARNFTAAANEWLLGDAPFTAKLHPVYAPYAEYDQLMRLDEWYGRESAQAGGSETAPAQMIEEK
jgi:ATP-dependent helicase/nuclease subunit B